VKEAPQRKEEKTHQFPPVRLPSRDRILTRHRQVDRVERNRVPPTIARRPRPRSPTCRIPALEQALVVRRVVLLVEAGRESEVGELDVTVFVDQDVVGFDVAVRGGGKVRKGKGKNGDGGKKRTGE
jgi:hypothetical protein